MEPAQSERHSLKFCVFSEITFRLHWSVFLTLAIFGFAAVHAEFTLFEAGAVVVGALSVLLIHSLGHVVAMRFLGWKVDEIVIFPYGELYSIQAAHRAERKSLREHLTVSGFGLLASFVLYLTLVESGVRFPYLLGFSSVREALVDWSLIVLLMNALPLLPFDLGRIVQLLLDRSGSSVRKDSFFVLQEIVAGLLFIGGLAAGYPILAVIAIGSLFIATREHYFERARTAAEGHLASEITMPRDKLICFTHGTTLSAAQRTLLQSNQLFFPVLLQEKLLGFLSRTEIRELGMYEENAYLGELLDPDYFSCTSDTPLRSLVESTYLNDQRPIAVVDDGTFVGIISREQLFDFLIIRTQKLPEDDDAPITPKKTQHKDEPKIKEKK